MSGGRFEPPAGFRGGFGTEPEDLDRAANASGVIGIRPAAVATPADADDVAALVAWAAARGLPLVPRGAATGMPGGNVGPGVAVDLRSAFRAVHEVGPAHAVLEPGVTLAELNTAAARFGAHFPVDPSSGASCTFGGMIANNSSGAHSLRYGAVRDWVERLELVLADGSRCSVRRGERPDHPRLRAIAARIDAQVAPHHAAVVARWPRVRKNSSGYALAEYLRSRDLLDLVVGSEGTLAIVVGARVRLAPLPAERGLALLEFSSLEAAGDAVLALLPHAPDTCELLDRTLLDLVREAGADRDYPLRAELEAILLVEVEGEHTAAVRDRLDAIRTAVRGTADRVETAVEPAAQRRFWHVRHAASPLIGARDDGRVSMQFIEDGVVPVERLPDYVRALRRVLDRHGVPAVIFGHAGEGNLHVNPLVDVREPAWTDTVERILDEVTDAVAALGGTLAGEHGDGRLRAPLLERIWGSEMVALFHAVKQAFDPQGILNPGVVLPLPGQRPLDGLRQPVTL